MKDTYVHSKIRISSPFSFPPDFGFDALPDGQLASALADFRQISSGETVSNLSDVIEIDFASNWRFPQVCTENRLPGFLIRQRDVNQLIETAGTKYCRVDDICWKLH